MPGESFQAERSAGSASGAFELAYALSEGREAGKVAASEAGFRKRGSNVSTRVELEEETLTSAALFHLLIDRSREIGRSEPATGVEVAELAILV